MHTLLFLLAGTYTGTLNLQAHVRAMARAKPLAVCDDKLVAEKPQAKDENGKVEVTSPCHPAAWLAGFPGLKPGKTESAKREKGGFTWGGKPVNVEAHIAGGKEAVLTLDGKEIYRAPATAVRCAWVWAGDLNGDQQLDLIADCVLNDGQLPPVTGVFLSGKKGYQLTRQTFVAGSI